MFQKMLNYVTINIPELDLTTVTDIEVTFKQKSTGTELTYSGSGSLELINDHSLTVKIPKDDAMRLNRTDVAGQVMFKENGVPNATQVFVTSVDELLKEDGYGN